MGHERTRGSAYQEVQDSPIRHRPLRRRYTLRGSPGVTIMHLSSGRWVRIEEIHCETVGRMLKDREIEVP